tara:strand:+ start:2928 stop:3068 length:141 start_codon:yes stop_codon:yes gene_type:complete
MNRKEKIAKALERIKELELLIELWSPEKELTLTEIIQQQRAENETY